MGRSPYWLVVGVCLVLAGSTSERPLAQSYEDKLLRNTVGATLRYTNRMVEAYITLFKSEYSQGSLRVTQRFSSEFSKITAEVVEALKAGAAESHSIKLHYVDKDALLRLDDALACKTCTSPSGRVQPEPRPRTYAQLKGIIERRLRVLTELFSASAEQSIPSEQIDNIEDIMRGLRTILLAYDPLEFAQLTPDMIDRLKAQLAQLGGVWTVGEYKLAISSCSRAEDKRSVCAKIISGPHGVGDDLLRSGLTPKGGFYTARVQEPESGAIGPAKISVISGDTVDISFCSSSKQCTNAEAKRVK